MKWRIAIGAMIVVFGPAKAQAQQHVTDVWIGRSGGNLALSPAGLIPGTVYHPLLPVNTFLHGWSGIDPGFDRVSTSVGGVNPLSGTYRIWLEVIELKPALYVLGPSLSYTLEFPGDRGLIGDQTDLHEHLTWFIDETDPRFDPKQCVWEGTFRLVATVGGLQPSGPFTLLLTNAAVRGGVFPPMDFPATGDWDEDRDVDAEDLAAFDECLIGPERRPIPVEPHVADCEVDCHNAFDFDDDLDVDLRDVAKFQNHWDP